MPWKTKRMSKSQESNQEWKQFVDPPPLEMPEAVMDLYYRNHPVEWAERFLGVHLWSAQKDILNLLAKHPRVAVRAGHSVGKSFLASVFLLWYMHTRPRSMGLLTAPTYPQMRGVVYKEMRRLSHAAKKKLPIRILKDEVRMLRADDTEYPDWFIRGFSSDRGDRVQGQHAPGGVALVVDEATGVDLEMWEALQSLPTGKEGRILLLGNPIRADGFFADAFKGKGNFQTYKISVMDSPNFTGEEVPHILTQSLASWNAIEPWFQAYGEDSSVVQSRVYAEFPTEGEDAVFPREWIERAQAREPNPKWEVDRVLGIDPAHMGADLSVWIGIYGHRVTVLRSEGKTPDTTIAGEWTANKVGEDRIERVGIDLAFGTGIASTLRQRKIPVEEIDFGSAARDKERYYNKRAEMYFQAREFLREHAILPPDLPGRFIEELYSVRYIYDDSRIKIERKDEIRKRLGRSPDYADAFCLAVEMRKPVMDTSLMKVFYGIE